MKKLFILIACVAITGCRPRVYTRHETSVYNYKNSVVVDKTRKDSLYSLKIRISERLIRTGDTYFKLKTIYVPKYEFDLFQLGDTIKLEKGRDSCSK